MAPSLKATFKLASHAFIRRENAQSLLHLDQLFALLPSPPSQTWGAELPPKSRLQERWRNQAAALFLTVSTVEFKSHREQDSSEDGDEAAETFVKSLSDRISSLYRPKSTSNPGQQQEPLVPPNLISTLAMSSKSLGVPSSSTRTMVESYLAALPSEILDSLAPPSTWPSPSEDSERPWWIREALDGYEGLMELYLVDVLAGGDGAGEGEREEAKRLLDWDGVVSHESKERILARLELPKPSAPPNHPTLLPPAIETSLASLSDLPISPPQTPSPKSPLEAPEVEPQDEGVLTPISIASPITPLPVVTSSPVRPPNPTSRAFAITRELFRTHQTTLTSTVPPFLAFVVLLVLRRRDSPLLRIKVWRKWILWFLRTAWRDIRFTWALATSITYV
ncbi:hypothetical protein BDY24DRAFT_381234 [Mrakia frigida]|uniref:uncharacterized protein n=1 Tax=Mrakia frigida TaxID=29902 RepID=UPI003FCC1E78